MCDSSRSTVYHPKLANTYFNLKYDVRNFKKCEIKIANYFNEYVNFHEETYLFRRVEFPALKQHVHLPPTVRVHMTHPHHAEYLRALAVLP